MLLAHTKYSIIQIISLHKFIFCLIYTFPFQIVIEKGTPSFFHAPNFSHKMFFFHTHELL